MLVLLELLNLNVPIMTYEDVQLAQQLSKAEVEDFTGKKVMFFDEDLIILQRLRLTQWRVLIQLKFKVQ